MIDFKKIATRIIYGVLISAGLVISIWFLISINITKNPLIIISGQEKLVIPQITKTQIDETVHKIDYIVGIQIVTVDLARNARLETYMSIDDPFLQDAYNTFVNNKVVETPAFTTEKRNNERLLRLISGEYICIPYNETTAYKYAPHLTNKITSVCAIGIPPNKYGEFSGILTIYIFGNIDDKEKERLFYFARTISSQVAENNLDRY